MDEKSSDPWMRSVVDLVAVVEGTFPVVTYDVGVEFVARFWLARTT